MDYRSAYRILSSSVFRFSSFLVVFSLVLCGSLDEAGYLSVFSAHVKIFCRRVKWRNVCRSITSHSVHRRVILRYVMHYMQSKYALSSSWRGVGRTRAEAMSRSSPPDSAAPLPFQDTGITLIGWRLLSSGFQLGKRKLGNFLTFIFLCWSTVNNKM